MFKYILKRIALSIVIVFVIATITFFLCHAIPGGPFDREKPLNPTILENLNKKYNKFNSCLALAIIHLK